MSTSFIPHNLLVQAKNFVESAYSDNHLAGPREGLKHHSLATAVISMYTIPKSYTVKLARVTSSSPEAVEAALMLAGLMHDWGKSLAPYQEYLRVRGTHAPVRHEVASFIAITSLIKPRKDKGLCYVALTGAILYHHHGLYDFVEKIVKYLRGGVRAWPNTHDDEYRRDVRERLNTLLNALGTYLEKTRVNEILALRGRVEEIIEDLTQPKEPLRTIIREAVNLEGQVNQCRHVVTPLLAAVMIGDNVSANAVRAEGTERKRVLKMSKASAPVIAIRKPSLIEALKHVGLSNYADNLSKIYEELMRDAE